jgi:hypothetical protein
MAPAVPNFVLIGAAKAGTTSLHRWLGQHPDIFVPRQKELHFFAAPWLRENCKGPGDARVLQDIPADWDAYRAHYRGAAGRRAIGDLSPSYFAWWPSRDAIRDRLGHPKIVLALRDPVEKAYSQYMHLVRDGRETLSFAEALAAEEGRTRQGFGALWRYVGGVLYAEPTERFLETFGPERVRILFFEDLVRDPQGTMRDLLTFLEVDPTVPIDTASVSNPSGAPKSPALAMVLNNPTLRKVARSLLPGPLVTRLGALGTALNTGVKPELDRSIRTLIEERVAADSARLARLIGRDLPWTRTPRQAPS